MLENIEKYGINGQTIYDKFTGEVVDIQELITIKTENAINEFHTTLSEIRDLGGNDLYQIVKYKNREYNCIEIKREYEFNKEFRVELRDLMLSKSLSKNARMFIGTLTPFISFPSNVVIIKGTNPTYEVLMDILDISRPVLLQTLTELEKQQIIKRNKVNGQNLIYFNCFLYSGGKCVEKSCYELFKDSAYNHMQ